MRKRLVGTVTGDKMNKSRRVEVQRTYRHPKYGKTVRRTVVCHTHDEENQSKNGDVVEIIECRPMSKLKRWSLVKVMRHGIEATAAVAGEQN